ncbi:hypothetical protein H4R22_002519 [Coemansia sp. RSA 1290]|nr:hypothetical protein H4R22_002519 [Coemansia sp. RSA 1290]
MFRHLLPKNFAGIQQPAVRHCRAFSSRIYRPDGSTVPVKEELTPLAKHIRDMILATGPISVAKYMQLALTSPIGGYYTKGQGIGRTGDFVTSPEISQMFGEIMAVWFVLHWEMFGRPQNTVFVELGPGKGTLMDDMLRAAQRFPQFYAALKGVHLVERSPELRREQFKKLNCQHGQAEMTNEQAPKRAVTSRGNLPVEWHDVLDEVCAKEAVPLVMAHEFFDALPIYKFERGADDLWHEILVDVHDSNEQAVEPSTAKLSNSPQSSMAPSDAQHFKLVRTRSVSANAALLLRDKHKSFSKGDQIEVSPESAQVMTQLAKWISARNGMGLVVDYGQNWTQGDTFRGIKSHKFANPLSSPGSMDLTADVDFSYLSYAANGLAQCHGPMEQGAFLHAMGIQARLQQLLQTTRETQMHKRLVECYKRLTDPHSMGRIYKVMAVLPESAQQTPVPFSNIQKAA